MTAPMLSIILPNYNHAEFLPRALAGFAAQSFHDYELIIIDDASTDGSVELIKLLTRNDPRVRFYQNERNCGVVATLNRALSLATGTYVHGASADDYILPGYYKSAMELFGRHPQAGVCVGVTECVREWDGSTFQVPTDWAEEASYLSPELLATRMTDCGVPGPAIWRRDAVVKVGGYLPELRWHSDWYALQVAAFRHGLCFIPKKCAVVRVTETAYSNGQNRKPVAQRLVLQSLTRLLLSEENRDVLPHIIRSGVLRQFGAEMVRAAAALFLAEPTQGIAELVRDHFLANFPDILSQTSPQDMPAVVRLLACYGQSAFPAFRLLGQLRRTASPETAAVITATRAAILKATPLKTKLRYFTRRAFGSVTWGLDRATRPLYHYRLERQELLMEQMIHTQRHLAEVVGAVAHELRQMRQDHQNTNAAPLELHSRRRDAA